jgi:drug/metabolite transporter (DMT)-like permease
VIVSCSATLLCMENSTQASAADGQSNKEMSIGTMMALATAASSAAGGIFMEKVLARERTGEQSMPITSSSPLLWAQQAALAFFSFLLAVVYILAFEHEKGLAAFIPRHWDWVVGSILVTHALLGIVVAMVIHRFGTVYRLVLGSVSVCVCVLLEAMCFDEPIQAKEALAMILVATGSFMFSSSPEPCEKCRAIGNDDDWYATTIAQSDQCREHQITTK